MGRTGAVQVREESMLSVLEAGRWAQVDPDLSETEREAQGRHRPLCDTWSDLTELN